MLHEKQFLNDKKEVWMSQRRTHVQQTNQIDLVTAKATTVNANNATFSINVKLLIILP